MSIPPIERLKKLIRIAKKPLEVPLMILTEMMMSIIQVASLMSDSPSIKDLNFCGAPTSFKRATTAAVSVQERIDPIRNALMLV
jgi:hypothetical protein